MQKVLVGIDGSAESQRAADQAAQIAQALGRELLLAYVVSLPPALGPEPLELRQWEVAEHSQAKSLLSELSAKYADRGLRVDTVMPSGMPAEVLASTADASDVALVVVGHRGRNPIARALLGSVADRLLQISPKPVLVAR
jgi:nucleotide-binding universal stress UspA family protein